MILTVPIEVDKNPRLAVQAEGLILCIHELILRQARKQFWKVEEDNVTDRNPEDLDSRLQSDIHPIGERLQSHKGLVILQWRIDAADLRLAGELYAVSLAIVQDTGFTILGRYTSEDPGFGTLQTIRHETGFAILDVS